MNTFRISACYIFGTRTDTPSIEQLTVYIGFYTDKAKSDGKLAGQKIIYKHFNDGIMECKHKESKQGNFVFNERRKGPMGKHEYQQKLCINMAYLNSSG